MTIAADLACALDPVLLSRQVGITPDPWQADVLRSSAPRQLLNCCRQSGKSTTVATLAVHGALYEPDTLTLLLSPSLRQSGELFKKCTSLYRDLGRPVPADSATALSLTLQNGSRIVSLPGKEGTVRGFSKVRRLIVDEAARVPDELYVAVRPMLAVSGGQLIALSTPWGKRGWWYREWTEGGSTWQRTKVAATQCPRIPADFLAEERTSLGAWWYRQEYECEFEDTTFQVFPTDLVLGAFRNDIAPLFLEDVPAGAPGINTDVAPLFAV